MFLSRDTENLVDLRESVSIYSMAIRHYTKEKNTRRIYGTQRGVLLAHTRLPFSAPNDEAPHDIA